MSNSSKISGCSVHLHLVAIEPCSSIVFSKTEYELIFVALSEFIYNHINPHSDTVLSEKGISILDSLRSHILQHYFDLPSSSRK